MINKLLFVLILAGYTSSFANEPCRSLNTGVINFVGSNIQIDQNSIVAGLVPNDKKYGEIFIGGQNSDSKYSSFGTSNVAIFLNTSENDPSFSGKILLSQAIIQDIQYKVEAGQITIPNYISVSSYTPISNIPEICVSSIALKVNRYNNRLYGGQIYLYLNGSNHGYVTTIY